jgi:Mlc titration factor MtfA (ptsG expression regulator)
MTYFGILAILLLTVLLIFFNRAMKEGWYSLLYHTGLQNRRITEADKIRINNYLQNFSYYLALSSVGKEKFVDRLFTFMLNKEFRGCEGLTLTEEMRVLISASAIQLTFGLERYRLESLQSIFVHPDTFHLSEYSPEYKGATYGHHMHISWKAFQEGYSRSDDNLNLGLHEMTHAL